jgi:hypothetical protein
MELGWQQVALAIAAVLFLGFLVFRMWPAGSRRAGFGPEVRAARDRARAATTPRARAEALVEAARLSVRDGARMTAAAGLFLRAMHSDPTWPDAVTQMVLSFRRRRPRLLEKVLWRRLAQLPWDAEHRAVLREVTSGLAGLYERELRERSKAEVLRRMRGTFEAR